MGMRCYKMSQSVRGAKSRQQAFQHHGTCRHKMLANSFLLMGCVPTYQGSDNEACATQQNDLREGGTEEHCTCWNTPFSLMDRQCTAGCQVRPWALDNFKLQGREAARTSESPGKPTFQKPGGVSGGACR